MGEPENEESAQVDRGDAVVQPGVLAPLAAVGLVALMAGAIITHLRRHETKVIASPMVLLALAVLVAWGRFGPQSFTG